MHLIQKVQYCWAKYQSTMFGQNTSIKLMIQLRKSIVYSPLFLPCLSSLLMLLNNYTCVNMLLIGYSPKHPRAQPEHPWASIRPTQQSKSKKRKAKPNQIMGQPQPKSPKLTLTLNRPRKPAATDISRPPGGHHP